MKKLHSLVLALLCLMAPALAESPDALPVPEGCTLTDGWTGDTTAMHLMDKPDGTTVLACFVRTEDGWALTESTALPEGTDMYVKYAQEGSVTLALPIRLYEDYFQGITLDVEVCLVDGTWQVTGVMCPILWMDFRDNSILGPECTWYGDVDFDGDITRIDWMGLPQDEAACLARIDASQWRYIAVDTPVQREGTGIIDCYYTGTPVRLLETDGETALVAVLGGDVHIRVPEAALKSAEGQIYADDDVMFINPFARHTPTIEIGSDVPSLTLYDTPGGQPIAVLPSGELRLLTFLTNCAEDSWFHVVAEWDNIDGYIRIEQINAIPANGFG